MCRSKQLGEMIKMNNMKIVPILCVLVTVMAVSSVNATLTHRYSFDTDASDSVGNADGTMYNGASVMLGQVFLDGAGLSGYTNAQYVDLPGNAIAINSYTDASFEMWYTVSNARIWARVFDFGNSDNGTGGNCITYIPNNDGSTTAIMMEDTLPGWNGRQVVAGPMQPDGETYAAVVVNRSADIPSLDLYINGSLAASAATTMSLSSVSNNFAFLGRSMYSGDPLLNGSINEFRIWDTALSADAIAANFEAGPDAVIPEPSTLALVGLGLIVLIRRCRL